MWKLWRLIIKNIHQTNQLTKVVLCFDIDADMSHVLEIIEIMR